MKTDPVALAESFSPRALKLFSQPSISDSEAYWKMP